MSVFPKSVTALFQSFLQGFRLVNGGDLQQLVNLNNSGKAGITALVGGTAVTSPVMLQTFNQVDTSTSSGTDSVVLPPSIVGRAVTVFNNTANTIVVFANLTNLANSPTADKIIDHASIGAGAASVTMATATIYEFSCASIGFWKASAGA